MPVHLNRPPHNARLHAWGRADTGWWGCISWMQHVRTAEGGAELAFAAWVPAATLSAPGWAAREELPRLRLPADSRAWPAPRGWPAWFVGVWLDGDPACPPGVSVANGPGWRRGA